jgi:endonuclease/exonuclease/phosphatase family metal-dependent hydrolase
MRIATWNVHCGLFEPPPGDCNAYLTDCLRAVSADIVCLQELNLPNHGERDFAEQLARRAGYEHVEVMALSRSHLTDGLMGLAILSHQPLGPVHGQILPNPKLVSTDRQGRSIDSHDKGLLRVEVDWHGVRIAIFCVHLLPFHRFNVAPSAEALDPAREALLLQLAGTTAQPSVICGDLNVGNIDDFMPGARKDFELHSLIHGPTRPDGRSHDHILHSAHLNSCWTRILPTRSDHHLCVTELQVLSEGRPHARAATGVALPAAPVAILHLSDLHFGPGEAQQGHWKTGIGHAQRRTQRHALTDLIKAQGLPRCPDFVVVSGDVTIAGQPEGWQSYLETVEPLVAAGLLPPADRFILVPGNHDVRWDSPAAPQADEAGRWRPFIDVLGARHPRPWIPAVDLPSDEFLAHALRTMDPQQEVWGGVSFEDDVRLFKRRSTAFPFVYDRRLQVLLYAFNSASIAGTVTTLPPKVAEDIAMLRHFQGAFQAQIANVLAEFDRHRQIDPARVDPRELTVFERIVAAITQREGTAFDGALKVAVLHHHVTSIYPEEVKTFETLLNAGQFKRMLHKEGFQLILHGHKHWTESFVDSAVSGGGAHLVVSGGTIGGEPATGRTPGFYWIEWQPAASQLSTRFVSLADADKPRGAFEHGQLAVFQLQRNGARQAIVQQAVGGRRAIDLRPIFREVELRLRQELRSRAATTDGVLRVGWAHRIHNDRPSTIATAYGLKILRIIGAEHPRQHGIAEALLAMRKPDGGWSASSHGAQGRPEATCWVIEALHADQPGSAAVQDAARALERMLENDVGQVTFTRTLSVSLALRCLATVLPQSAWVERLASALLAGAARDATGAPLYWSECLDGFMIHPTTARTQASVIHTAHAMFALVAADKAGEPARASLTPGLPAARQWLVEQPWANRDEQIQRPLPGSYEQLVVGHFTAPWVIVALLRAGHPNDDPRLTAAVRQIVDRRSQGLWNRGELNDWPIWAAHDALLALHEAALAGVALED